MIDNLTLSQLKKLDTPTVCNALEMIEDARRSYGFTTEQFFCLHPNQSAIVGLAKTATVRSLQPSGKTHKQTVEQRAKYYTYVSEGELPKICVMQDLDGAKAGNGAFWGTFNSSIHKSLNCEGVVTDGAVRDLGKIPKGFQMIAKSVRPSHGYIHIVDFKIQVNVCSMVVHDGDIVHADLHGAVCFPVSMAKKVVKAAKAFVESERPILDACKEKGITIDRILEIYKGIISKK